MENNVKVGRIWTLAALAFITIVSVKGNAAEGNGEAEGAGGHVSIGITSAYVDVATFARSNEGTLVDRIAGGGHLGLASFFHVSCEGTGLGWCRGTGQALPLAFSVGLGKTHPQKTTYLAGFSADIGGHAYLTLGYSWLEVPNVLPGHHLGELLEASGALPITHEFTGGPFISVSYIIAGKEDSLINLLRGIFPYNSRSN